MDSMQVLLCIFVALMIKIDATEMFYYNNCNLFYNNNKMETMLSQVGL